MFTIARIHKRNKVITVQRHDEMLMGYSVIVEVGTMS